MDEPEDFMPSKISSFQRDTTFLLHEIPRVHKLIEDRKNGDCCKRQKEMLATEQKLTV